MSNKIQNLFNVFAEGREPRPGKIVRYKRADGTTALKSLSPWGQRKDWRDSEGGLAKAKEHAKTDVVSEEVEIEENFMDGKGPGKPGDAARHGLKGKSASELRSIRSSDTSSPRKKQLAHWMLNMHHNESVNEGLKDPKDNPCWKGYEPVGTKKKNGKTVPNCVPVSEEVPCAEPITTDPDLPTSRFIGSDSIVQGFKNMTPGQAQDKVQSQKETKLDEGAMDIIRGGIRYGRDAVAAGRRAIARLRGAPPTSPTPRRAPPRAPQPPRSPAPRPNPTPRPGPARAGLNRLTSRLGTLGLVGTQALGAYDDMGRKRGEQIQTYNQAGLTTGTAALTGWAGGEYGARMLARRAPTKLKIPAALVGGFVGATAGHDVVDAVGERMFHRESTDTEAYEHTYNLVSAILAEHTSQPEKTDLNESFDLAFDYQGKPQLAPTAGQLMMQAKGAFAHHTDVQNVIAVQSIKESIQKQFEQTVLEEDTELLEQRREVLADMVDRALETIASIKESNVDRDAWSEAQILKLESYIESVGKYLDNIEEDTVPVVRRSYMRTDPRTGERKRVKGRTYKRRRDFNDDEDEDQDMPKGPRSV